MRLINVNRYYLFFLPESPSSFCLQSLCTSRPSLNAISSEKPSRFCPAVSYLSCCLLSSWLVFFFLGEIHTSVPSFSLLSHKNSMRKNLFHSDLRISQGVEYVINAWMTRGRPFFWLYQCLVSLLPCSVGAWLRQILE